MQQQNMRRQTVELTLASSVATNGTFTVTYPTGFSAGDFSQGHKHRMIALQSEYKYPKDFTISFGATTATITYLGTTTLPAGTKVFFGFDMAGADGFTDNDWRQQRLSQYAAAQLVLVNFGSPSAADDDSLIDAATGSGEMPATSGAVTHSFAGGGGSSPMDGAMSDGVIGNVPRNLTYSFSHATSIPNLTITAVGYNGDEVVVEETSYTSGSTTGSATGAKTFTKMSYFKIVENDGSTATGTTLNIGVGSILGFPFPLRASNQIAMELHDNALQGVWRDNIALPYNFTASELGTGTAKRLICPVNGVVVNQSVAISGAANSGTGTIHISVAGADTNAAGTTVAGTDVTIADADTIGSSYSSDATEGDSSQQISVQNQIVVAPGAGFTTGAVVNGIVTVRPTYTLRGTLVVADESTPSGTTGDTRGTYTPAFTLDGTTEIALWCFTADPQSRGTPEYAL